MASNLDEIMMQHSLHFAEGLKDLRNLRNQLYSAAEYFESSYDKADHKKQSVVESSKHYVAKAIVSTVDHLGSVADKLNKFLDDKANEFSSTQIRFSCIQQRIKTFQGVSEVRGLSQHCLTLETPILHSHYVLPLPDAHTIRFGTQSFYRDCISSSNYSTLIQHNQDNPFSKAFQATLIRAQPPLLRKGHSRISSRESNPNPLSFSLKRTFSHKGAEFGLGLKRSGSGSSRVCEKKQQRASDYLPVCIKPETKDSEREMETCNNRRKNVLKVFMLRNSK